MSPLFSEYNKPHCKAVQENVFGHLINLERSGYIVKRIGKKKKRWKRGIGRRENPKMKGEKSLNQHNRVKIEKKKKTRGFSIRSIHSSMVLFSDNILLLSRTLLFFYFLLCSSHTLLFSLSLPPPISHNSIFYNPDRSPAVLTTIFYFIHPQNIILKILIITARLITV